MGAIVGALGDTAGFPVAFLVMAVSFALAAIVILPIHAGRAPAAALSSAPDEGHQGEARTPD